MPNFSSDQYVNISRLPAKLRELLANGSGVFQICVMKNGKPVAIVLSIAEHEVLEAMASRAVDDEEYKKVRRGETDEYVTVAGADD